MMQMRYVNGRITEHVKITKDKYGEVELTILLLNTAFNRFQKMPNDKWNRADTFADYVVKRTLSVLKVLEKLHEDHYLDFKEDLNQLFTSLHTYRRTTSLARENAIPKQFEW